MELPPIQLASLVCFPSHRKSCIHHRLAILGEDRPPDAIKLRMIAGLMSLCLVAFWAAFTGNLIASLAGKERYSQDFCYSSIDLHLQVNSG